MKVLVDTSVWSLALRRVQPCADGYVSALRELIDEQRVVMIGPVRQELLSGIREPKQFKRLKSHLSAFPDLRLSEGDYEKAAEFFNLCRAKGVQGSNTDFLLCAISVHYKLALLTADQDFIHFSKHLPLKLFPVSVSQ